MKNNINKNLAFDSIIFSLILILTFVKPLGYPQIGPLQATTVHIPVIIAIAYYRKYSKSLMFGIFFGISSLLANIMAPGPLSPFFINPLVSILPRVLMALGACYFFNRFSVVVSAFIASYLNTFFVLSSLTFLYKSSIEKIIPGFWKFMQTIIFSNALIEAIIASFITSIAISRLVKKKSI